MDGDEYLLQFISHPTKPEYIWVTTNKEVGARFPIKIDGKEVEVHRIGQFRMSQGEYPEIAPFEEVLIDNMLLISSALVKMGYEYIRKNWASIINLGICK